jgi:hypothetical protein
MKLPDHKPYFVLSWKRELNHRFHRLHRFFGLGFRRMTAWANAPFEARHGAGSRFRCAGRPVIRLVRAYPSQRVLRRKSTPKNQCNL